MNFFPFLSKQSLVCFRIRRQVKLILRSQTWLPSAGLEQKPYVMRHFCVETGGYISLPFGYFYLSYRSEKLGQARTTSRLATLKFSRSNSNPTPVFWSHFDLKIWNSKWQEKPKSKISIGKSIENFRNKVESFEVKFDFFEHFVLTFQWKFPILSFPCHL